jgi:hypothetical protein
VASGPSDLGDDLLRPDPKSDAHESPGDRLRVGERLRRRVQEEVAKATQDAQAELDRRKRTLAK